MSIKVIKTNTDKYSVLIDDCDIGFITRYHNRFHATHCYLKLNLLEYSNAISKFIFKEIYKIENKPLQIMLDATGKEIISFVESGGFVCRRKCYDIAVTVDDLIYKSDAQIALKHCQFGSVEYEKCARIMYNYYKETHQKINPLTAPFESFLEILPNTTFYYTVDTKIMGVIFTEENEIAYLYLNESDSALDFAHAVISQLFRKHSSIAFECDDVDDSAMKLVSMFKVDLRSACSTYTYIK